MRPMSATGNRLLRRPDLQVRWPAWWSGFVVLLLVFTTSWLGWAQTKPLRDQHRGIYLPSERLDTRGVQRAQTLIAQGEFSQAIRFLDEILQREEDSFVSGADDEFYGLKETARQMLKALPSPGRRIYESTFGPVARRLLQQATASGDLVQLRSIAHRYFYTPAGHEAALLFAQNEADQGHHLTAALTYQQLLETPEAAARFQPQLSVLAATSWLAADYPARAAEVLESLHLQGYRDIQLSGADFPVLASENGLVDWLLETVGSPVLKDLAAENQWLTMRGNASRNGHTEGGLPHLRVRWQVRLLEHHILEKVHEQMAGVIGRQKKSRLPAATPLAVGDYVITRSAHGLIAIDFDTGKRIWQAQPQRDSMLENLLEVHDRPKENDNGIEPAQSFARMIWEDYLYNTISSDGRRVYVIRDLAPPKPQRMRHLPFIQQPSNVASDNETNRLCAYDLPTQGKLVWEIDGAARKDALGGVFFLGAPVTVGQSLYCLAEIKSETAIYLIVLDRNTGELSWRQQLADLETGVAHDMSRRLQAAMPSYGSGTLVCPTGAGVVVGVDLAKQALAWAYRYDSAPSPILSRRIGGNFDRKPSQQWVHSAPVIADGKVLLTPPESDHLHCLDLLTGKLLWKQPRGAALYLAGVEDGLVLLVGNRNVSAINLEDGKQAWAKAVLEFPDGSTPTGSGFFSKGKYFLPLSNAQVIAVDVATGRMAAKAGSRDGQLLGNLICYRGAVISQTGRHLDCFEQVDVLRAKSEQRRAEDPTDFEALRTLGEIAYNDGQMGQAVQLLSEAYASKPDDLRTREVLSEALVAALDEQFANYQDRLPLLGEIQQQTMEAQLTLMRLQAKGLQGLSQPNEAFDVCLSAYDVISDQDNAASGPTVLSIGNDHQLTAERWLAAQASSAWASATPDQRDRIVEQLLPRLERVMQVTDTSRWQQFHNCFGAVGQTEPFALELATKYLEQNELLAAQQLLLTLTKSEIPTIRHAAIALCSRLLHEGERPFLALPYDELLRGSLADVECLPGLTGSACLAEWSSGAGHTLPDWPYGQVEVNVQKSKTANSKSHRNPQTGIYLERTDEILGSCGVTLLGLVSGRDRAITVRDSLGRDFYQAKLDRSTQMMMNSQGSVYGVSRGNLLVLSVGRQIIAYDTLSRTGQPLWRKDTTSNLQQLNSQRLNHRNVRIHGIVGRHRSGRTQSNGSWLGLIGPVTRDSCLFQVEEQLVAIDNQTGDIRWSRENMPLGVELFGDEEFLFVVPNDSDRARVLSIVDGRDLGETSHALPHLSERLSTVGRQVIRWRRRVDRRWELSAVDALNGDVSWKYEFAKNTKVDVAQNRFVVAIEPTGHCTILDISNGEQIVNQAIDASISLENVYLLAGSKHFVVAIQQPHEIDRKRVVTTFNRTDFPQVTAFSGQIYLFNRQTGSVVWSRPAEVQGLPFMLHQPVDLPTIAFAGNIQRRDRSGSRREMGIMLLEKASGRECSCTKRTYRSRPTISTCEPPTRS